MANHFHLVLQICILIFTIIISTAKSAPNSNGTEMKWTHELVLDRGFVLKWTREDPVWLTMEMSAPTTGYVAIGFSPNGGMKGSDIVMGWIDANGTGQIKDLYAIGSESPWLDPEQNYELLSAVEIDNRTTIRFRRKWNTCDQEHDFQIGDDTVRIIWAYHEQDPSIDNGTFRPPYHEELRGVRRSCIRIPAKHAEFPEIGKEGGAKHWDIRMANNNVSAEDSSIYFCKIVKFTNLERKHHMIGFQPLLDEATKHNIHHMLLAECIVPASDGGTMKSFEEYVSETGGKCYTPNKQPTYKFPNKIRNRRQISNFQPKFKFSSRKSRYCINLPVLWTSGSEGNMFPDNVGFPLGEENGGSTYFFFEIHYDNPQLKSFSDSSGIRIFYTDQLRENDGGVIAVGHKISPFQVVPPSMPVFTAQGYCTSECTAQVIPPAGINVISVLLHAHLQGRKITLKHLRNGLELPTLAKDNMFDNKYQHARVIQPSRQILPGDELLTICEYDTTGITTPAFGGRGARDEMCMAFVYYYPKIPLEDCKSQPEFNSFLNALGIQKVGGEMLTDMNMPYIPKDNQELDWADDPYSLKNSTYDCPLVAFDAMNIIESDDQSVGLSYQTLGDWIRNISWGQPIGKAIEKKWIDGKHYAFCTGPSVKRHPLKEYIVSMPKYVEYVEPAANQCYA